ncbi:MULTISPECIES: hypothetical protein [Rhodococcus]|uniref:hypothetical protein n=1 Tax=Rhodococcus TaxID=1827 RepID=UPI0021665E87|nr:hypothetical protein [Rhodococcus globerulus]
MAVTGLALIPVGCGSKANEVAEGPAISVTEAAESIPERVSVDQPGLVDPSVSANELPTWPGPDPSGFLRPNPPSGQRGELAGTQATAVYLAARENPEALWNVGGIVRWLIVTPVS